MLWHYNQSFSKCHIHFQSAGVKVNRSVMNCLTLLSVKPAHATAQIKSRQLLIVQSRIINMTKKGRTYEICGLSTAPLGYIIYVVNYLDVPKSHLYIKLPLQSQVYRDQTPVLRDLRDYHSCSNVNIPHMSASHIDGHMMVSCAGARHCCCL